MTLKSKTMRWVPWIMLAAVSLLSGRPGFAGSESGGGGDTATELKVDEIRADLLKWIGEGGARGLVLPSSITYKKYEADMTKVLIAHRVVIGSVTPEEEKQAVETGNEELQVSVAGQPKTCRSFKSKKDRLFHILCNVKRFSETPPPSQYQLIHHEYAGLAKLEKNIDASSDYEISRQLTEFLAPETVLRLSVKRQEVPMQEPVVVYADENEDFYQAYLSGHKYRSGYDEQTASDRGLNQCDVEIAQAENDCRTAVRSQNQARVVRMGTLFIHQLGEGTEWRQLNSEYEREVSACLTTAKEKTRLCYAKYEAPSLVVPAENGSVRWATP